MARATPSARESVVIGEIVAAYESEREKVSLFMGQLHSALIESKRLAACTHSTKTRLKQSEHLREKLVRKLLEAKERGEAFRVTPGNVLSTVNDLAGIRILHLYTRQIREIDRALRDILEEQQYRLREGPFARTWDDESRAFFVACGIATQESPTMYTSVHYVVESASRTVVTCEIQVRTLMEEVWGEVDHQLNYPVPTSSLACREQLKVLARVTSSASRLVDSIFLTAEEGAGERVAAAPEMEARRAGRKSRTDRGRK